MGPLANKVWGQPVTLAGSAPRPCGHEDLSRIFLCRWLRVVESKQLELELDIMLPSMSCYIKIDKREFCGF